MRYLPIVLVMLLIGQLPASAQGPALGEDGVAARLNRLEAETDTLRNELQWLRENPVPLPAIEATPASSSSNLAPAAGDGDYFTLAELQAEMKKIAWTKGDFRIVPYGFLWGNMVYASARTTPGSYTLYVPSATLQGESEFVVDARNTRLGFDVAGPRIPCFNCAQSGGKVEIDFQNSVLSTENKPTIMLRHAYWEVKDEEFRVLFGQTWDVISPLFPGMLMYSVGWDGGNIGYRRAQLRGERFLAFDECTLWTLQASANQQVFEDSTATVRGETSNWPILEMRTAVTLGDRGKGGLPVTFGVSGHIGEEQYDFAGIPALTDVRRRTWSLNGDVRIPITERLGFQGEFFTGENLGAFLGGIGQGIDPLTGENIRSTGGWLEMWYDWTPRLHSHFGYGIDDPNDADLVLVGSRAYNQFVFGNLSYDITKNFLAGIEVSGWRTLYVGQEPGNSVRTEFVMKYGF